MLGHPDLVTPYSTTQFHVTSEAMRKHHRAMAIQNKTIIGELRPALAELPSRIAFGADAKINAYRVCRQFVFAASLNLETAGAYVKAYDLYHELFLNKKNSGSRPKFDPNR